MSPRGAPPSRPRKAPSRFAAWRTELGERLARSSKVFLAGLLVACGIEVFLDWNSTIFEINVLRNGMRERALSYVGILARAGAEPVHARDPRRLEALCSGLFDDPDVGFVRVTDAQGATVYERLAPAMEQRHDARHGTPFAVHYARQMDRDVRGLLREPAALRARFDASRYRDFVQVWNDAMARAMALVVAPAPSAPSRGRGERFYQDRLRDEQRRHDGDLSYAVGTVIDEQGANVGAVLLAFDLSRVNAAITLKLAKGGGMVVFFVALILVQNMFARRDKLRLLQLDERNAAAKRALLDALPADLEGEGLAVRGALEQAEGKADGLLWDRAELEDTVELLAIEPDGDGVDAAATALLVLRAYRARRAEGASSSLEEEARALGAATLSVPLARPVGLLLLRVARATGECEALHGSLAAFRVLEEGAARVAESLEGEVPAPQGVVGPLRRTRVTLANGATLLAVVAGLGTGEQPAAVDALASFLLRTAQPGAGGLPLEDGAVWARGRSAALASGDVLLLEVCRGP